MRDALLWLSPLTAILASLVAALCARACLKAASECSSAMNQHRQTSADLADLQSSYDSLLASHRKLAARVGMRAKRSRDAATDDLDPIAPGDKAALRARYLAGKSPIDIAREAMNGSVTTGD